MHAKIREKTQAVELRKQGKSYNEILEKVPVAKSTLSLWLRDVGLAKRQEQRLTKRKRAAQKRGGIRRHEMRLAETRRIHKDAKDEVGRISKRDLFILGIALYWAEGAKEKEWNPGSSVQFANSDPEMLRLFLLWLEHACAVDRSRITTGLYIHENQRGNIKKVKKFWAKEIGFTPSYVHFKKHNPKTKRNNTGRGYHGVISIRVRKSSALNRRIAGWIYGIIEDDQNCPVV